MGIWQPEQSRWLLKTVKLGLCLLLTTNFLQICSFYSVCRHLLYVMSFIWFSACTCAVLHWSMSCTHIHVLHSTTSKFFRCSCTLLQFQWYEGIALLSFFNYRPNFFEMTKFFCQNKKLSQFSHNVWEGRLVNTILACFNTIKGQMTKMSQWKTVVVWGTLSCIYNLYKKLQHVLYHFKSVNVLLALVTKAMS